MFDSGLLAFDLCFMFYVLESKKLDSLALFSLLTFISLDIGLLVVCVIEI